SRDCGLKNDVSEMLGQVPERRSLVVAGKSRRDDPRFWRVAADRPYRCGLASGADQKNEQRLSPRALLVSLIDEGGHLAQSTRTGDILPSDSVSSIKSDEFAQTETV